GILTSQMHNAWMRTVAGRLESRFRYSIGIVYNNFPWPRDISEQQSEAVLDSAQKVLDARSESEESSLADLYDPVLMPPNLVKAHRELNKAVELCYRPQPFPNDEGRVGFLFELYQEYLDEEE
ncbi:MAG: type IIL restriction-modification enzyme MmeI, partial [Euryarchaeota archaeon]